MPAGNACPSVHLVQSFLGLTYALNVEIISYRDFFLLRTSSDTFSGLLPLSLCAEFLQRYSSSSKVQ